MSLQVQRSQSAPVSSAGGAGALRNHSLLTAGSSGPEVAQLQQKLQAAGYEVGEKGTFDQKTLSAVKAYQADNGLLVDGKVGQQTWGSFYGVQLPPGVQMLGRATAPQGGAQPGHDTRDTFESSPVGGPSGSSNSARLQWAMDTARKMGLTITSTTGGTHAPGSYHYKGRAVDVAGSPEKMREFYNIMKAQRPTELFHDPMGGMKHGREIGAIGGHGRHVHVAF